MKGAVLVATIVVLFFCSVAFADSVKGLRAKSSLRGIDLFWEKTVLGETQSVVVVRKKGSCPASLADGEDVYRGNGTHFRDNNLPEESVCYGVFFVDISGYISPMQTTGLLVRKNILEWGKENFQENGFIIVGLSSILFLFRINMKKKKKLLLLVH